MELNISKTDKIIVVHKKPDLRERIDKKGINVLSDSELIAVLLRVGTQNMPVLKLSQEVLKVLERAKDEEDISLKLAQISGMGKSKISIINAALELGKRKFGQRGTIIRQAGDLFPLVSHYAHKKQEYFLCVSLNGAHEILEIRIVTIGILNRTVVHPREIYADPIIDRAAAIIICHNHPSGQKEPSIQDIDITRRIKNAGDILGIPLLDHLIITLSGYYSFSENGVLSS